MYETRSIAEAPTTDGNKIFGYGAVWNVETPYGKYGRERFAPGCLYWTGDVKSTWNHDDNFPLGRTSAGNLIIKNDDKGCWYEVEPVDTTAARDVKEMIRPKDGRPPIVTGSSVTMIVEESHYEGGVRVITKARLSELGPVLDPAYNETSVDRRNKQEPEASSYEVLKSLDDLLDTLSLDD